MGLENYLLLFGIPRARAAAGVPGVERLWHLPWPGPSLSPGPAQALLFRHFRRVAGGAAAQGA